ncbi:MAG: hypothetical protein LBU40_00035 [Methanobrevibacter sp.]|jgi:tetratricopeptide (TPR) repeat protein|nr:hypothetical protein [Methanobrevibacter sp.]
MSKVNKEKLLRKLCKEYDNSNYLRVTKIANQILKLDSNNHDAFFFKAASLSHLDKNEEYLELCKEAWKNNSNDLDFVLELADFLRNYDENEEAAIILEEAFKLNPENNLIMEKLLYALFEIDGLKRPFEIIDNFPKENPLWLDCLFFKSQLYSMKFMYKEALDVSNEILSHDPTHLNALSKKVFVLNKLERSDEAYEVIEFRIKNNLRPKWAKVDKAIYLLNKNRSSDALDLLDEVIDEDPNFAYALSTKASFANMAGENILALDYINRALENSDHRSKESCLLIKSQILAALGEYDESFDCLDAIHEDSMYAIDAIETKEKIEEELSNLKISKNN